MAAVHGRSYFKYPSAAAPKVAMTNNPGTQQKAIREKQTIGTILMRGYLIRT